MMSWSCNPLAIRKEAAGYLTALDHAESQPVEKTNNYVKC